MRLIFCLIITVIGLVFGTQGTATAATSKLIITEIRLGGEDVQNGENTYKQYVVLHNQSGQTVDLTDWRIQYAKSDYSGACSAAAWSSESQLSGTVNADSAIIVPYQLTDNAAGSVRVMDAASVVHDTVGWGESAPCFEAKPIAAVPDNGKSIVRYLNCDARFDGADSNDNSTDFASNQTSFSLIEAPDCTPECATGQQLVNGECVTDQCTNISGVQVTVPEGYFKTDAGCFEIAWIKITELLPNAKGADAGNEYIEIFNPTTSVVHLADYTVFIGDSSTAYTLPDVTIAAGGYVTVKDSDVGFTLANTKSRAVIKLGETVIDETPYYETAKENEAWALISGSWQYTNRPTPGADNQAMLVEVEEKDDVKTTELAPCAANQYRHPETNRCRLLSTDAADLAPCKEGQYRSEETNRCRSATTASAALTPCDPGEVRNPETNRCRKESTTASQLTPCKEGQERNPDTNRCRNAASTDVPAAAFAAEPVPADNKSFIGWWILGGVGVLAAGRIGWEWRSEIAAFFRRIGSFFTPGK